MRKPAETQTQNGGQRSSSSSGEEEWIRLGWCIVAEEGREIYRGTPTEMSDTWPDKKL